MLIDSVEGPKTALLAYCQRNKLPICVSAVRRRK